MTTRDEEQRAIAQTREFLFILLNAKSQAIRVRAHQLLRHFPILPLLRAGDRMRKCTGGKRSRE